MTKLYAFYFILLSFFFISCDNSDNSSPDVVEKEDIIKIEVISGNNQTDTIGRLLKNDIVLKVTKNGVPYSNMPVRCDIEQCGKLPKSYFLTNSEGLIQYKWELSGTIGEQKIHFVVSDPWQVVLDEIDIYAQAKYYNNAWIKYNCPKFSYFRDFCQSATGRIFSVNSSLIFYSDDNGFNWTLLDTTPTNDYIVQTLFAHGNEIYLKRFYGFGFYYSPDNGNTWQKRDNIANSPSFITKSGKLFCNNQSKNLVSDDTGLTWKPFINNSTLSIHKLTETDSGVIYMIGTNNILYKSTTGGTSWETVLDLNSVTGGIRSFLIDNNNDFYIATNKSIYKSGDYGLKWSLIHQLSDTKYNFGYDEFYKVNGIFYLKILGYGIVKTQDFKSLHRISKKEVLKFSVGNNNTVYFIDDKSIFWHNTNPN